MYRCIPGTLAATHIDSKHIHASRPAHVLCLPMYNNQKGEQRIDPHSHAKFLVASFQQGLPLRLWHCRTPRRIHLVPRR